MADVESPHEQALARRRLQVDWRVDPGHHLAVLVRGLSEQVGYTSENSCQRKRVEYHAWIAAEPTIRPSRGGFLHTGAVDPLPAQMGQPQSTADSSSHTGRN